MVTRVADLSVDELKTIIREVVTETILEAIRDPDKDLELREDFVLDLQYSLETFKAQGNTISAENVAADLGLSW